MHKRCSVSGCSSPAWSSRTLCKDHQQQYLREAFGNCPNHPDRPVAVKKYGLCASCTKKQWRKQHMITDEAWKVPGAPDPELAGIVDYLVREIQPVRSALARYLRTMKTEPTGRVYVAYHFLIMAGSKLSNPHWRFLLAEINDGAVGLDRIPDYRETA